MEFPGIVEIPHRLDKRQMETSFSKACSLCTGAGADSFFGAAWLSAGAETFGFCSVQFVPDQPEAEHCHMNGEGHEHPGEGDPRPPGVVVVQAQVS